ncbi:3-hydroxyacyl-CoA dehydrogenase [Aestuariispira insulae]|uniref:3-hydroxyacyl-CoA dehydrogenase n=1 Tax=Aestuariispira insulae TaxID=1461337 RepID=A0A3D9HVB8_9PROT|nr:3-hydroxyacyl-CoA dehydrogenase [Aestuariispira insulae]RED53355.1 3-hydroxyacyl-CoA dehydrogenase [Aestuariispira insulae]
MQPISKETAIAIVGAGAMGSGIAQVAATAGHKVFLFDTREGAAAKAIELLSPGLEKQVSRGKFTAAQKTDILSRIHPVDRLAQLADSGLVIEAIVEDLAIKQELFRQLEAICADNTILATNTSSLSVTAIASVLESPARLVGMHFFNPAQVMKLVEVVTGLATGKEFADKVFATAQAWGKSAVFAKSTPGFIVNRVARPFYAESWRMLEENVTDAVTIDHAVSKAGGFRMGPFALMDLIGHDINFAVTNSVYDACYQDPRYRPSLQQKELVQAGHLGRKTGQGIYNHGAEPPVPSFMETLPAPSMVQVCGALENTGKLAARLAESSIDARWEDGNGEIRCDHFTLALTDGRTATQRSVEEGINNLVLFDLALDYGSAEALCLAKADQTSEQAFRLAAGFLETVGLRPMAVDDSPGLVVMRTVAMLASEAAETVSHGVADAKSVDTAMTLGVNYPVGPLAYAEQVGLSRILTVLQALEGHFGEDRYRPSPFLRRKVLSGGCFLE